MIRISQIAIHIDKLIGKEDIETQVLKNTISKRYRLQIERILSITIVKKSIDARKKSEIKYIYTVDLEIEGEMDFLKRNKKENVSLCNKKKYMFIPSGQKKLECPPVIIGAGPAGLFCGLMLAREGYRPILLERGKDVKSRKRVVENFWKNNQLDPNCNVQFGEGGAGTFSDGKLNTLVKDSTGRNGKVLNIFVEHGASEEILYWNKPHIGTDKLSQIVESIRKEIISLGGKIYFDTCVTDFIIDKNQLRALEVNCLQTGEIKKVPCQVAVVAIGHSARDTFVVLKEKKVEMEQKAFAMGIRIEHSQEMIGKVQYGEGYQNLPTADYKVAYQTTNGRSVYSFCMCPGGFVVNASSENGKLVVNGMSNQDRGEKNANSGMVVSVSPEDFESDDVLAGIEFQRKWEMLAYKAGNGKIPTQLFGDFKKNQVSKKYGEIIPNMKGQNAFGNLKECLPIYVSKALEEGIQAFGKKIKDFDREDAVLSGVETRTSSPVRIIRNKQTLESNINGVYPCGEGAGYAGGITSAAMDGIKIFEAVASKYKSGFKSNTKLEEIF